MKMTRIITAPVSEAAARERITTFLTQSGYKQSPPDGGQLKFRRGSMLAAYANVNPAAWLSSLNFTISAEANWVKIYIDTEITTDPTEQRFGAELLTGELSLLESAVTINEFKIYDINGLKKNVTAYVYRVARISGSILISVIAGVALGQALSKKTDVTIFGSALIGGVTSLAMAALFLIFWSRKKQA
jgi:hypothetical protein